MTRLPQALLLGCLVGSAFWLIEGRDLSYEVNAGDVYSHDEEISAQGRILISAFVGIASTLGVRVALASISAGLRPKALRPPGA